MLLLGVQTKGNEHPHPLPCNEPLWLSVWSRSWSRSELMLHALHVSSQEYKVSSFEQRLISEIEFRLERSPVEESDEDVQHDEDSVGGMAPSFLQKIKHYKVFEGMPVTFSCKVTGDPKPKVRGPSWER